MIYNSGWVWSTPRCHSIRIKILEKAKVVIKLLERIDYIIFAFHWYPALFSGSHGWFPPSTGRQQFRNLQVLTDFVLISTWYISSQQSHFSQSVTPALAFVFIKMIYLSPLLKLGIVASDGMRGNEKHKLMHYLQMPNIRVSGSMKKEPIHECFVVCLCFIVIFVYTQNTESFRHKMQI